MVKGWDYRKRWIDQRNYPIWIVDNSLTVVHLNQPAGRILGTLPWKLAGKNVDLLLQALVAKIRINDRNAAGNFKRDYLKFLKGQHKGVEWKMTLTLEREVINKFYEKEKQIVDYDFLVQRELPRSSEGTRTYLTEKKSSTPPSETS